MVDSLEVPVGLTGMNPAGPESIRNLCPVYLCLVAPEELRGRKTALGL